MLNLSNRIPLSEQIHKPLLRVPLCLKPICDFSANQFEIAPLLIDRVLDLVAPVRFDYFLYPHA